MGNICIGSSTAKRQITDKKSSNKPELSKIEINVIRNNWKVLKMDIARIGTITFVR